MKKNKHIKIFLILLIINSFSPHLLEAQSIFQRAKDKLKHKTDSTINSTVDKSINSIFSKKKSGEKAGTTKQESGKPLRSELNESDFHQNNEIPTLQQGYSRLKIAGNLFIDVKGIYPEGYKPKWRCITYSSTINMTIEDWVAPGAAAAHNNTYIALGDIDGKAKFAFGAFINGSCYADIIIDSIAVISPQPQTFKVTKFQKVLNDKQTGEPCIGLSTYTQGGFEGRITLSSNDNGDITMDLMIENYAPARNTSYAGYLPASVSYRYLALGIVIANEMSPEKANQTVAAEQEAKQKQIDYIAKTTRQADSLQKLIAKKYPGTQCKDCFVRNSNSSLDITPTKTTYTNGYGDVYVESGTDWDVNTKTTIRNKCNYPLLFIGIEQFYDDEKGYYLKEVTKKMEVGYSYSSDQGILSSIFTAIVGGGSEFNFPLQDKYNVNAASVGYVQWLKVIKTK